MNASELETIWRKQALQAPDVEKIALLVATVSADDRRFRRQIWWRDFREVGAAVAVAVFFAITGRTWLSWIAIASSLFVAGYLLRSRLGAARMAEPLNLAGKIEQMIREVKLQIRLLRSIAWWYLLPAAIAFAAVTAEMTLLSVDSRFRIFMSAVFVLLLGGCYWLNRWVADKRLEPRREQLERLLTELQSS